MFSGKHATGLPLLLLILVVVGGFYNILLTPGPAEPVNEEASARLPQLYAADAAREGDPGCLSSPGDPPGVSKSNCQNKPKFPRIQERQQSYEGKVREASSMLPNGLQLVSALLTFHRKRFWLFLQVQTADSTLADISCYNTRSAFIKAPAERCSLPSWLHRKRRLLTCLAKSELPLCMSEETFSFAYPAFKKSFSLFCVKHFYRATPALR